MWVIPAKKPAKKIRFWIKKYTVLNVNKCWLKRTHCVFDNIKINVCLNGYNLFFWLKYFLYSVIGLLSGSIEIIFFLTYISMHLKKMLNTADFLNHSSNLLYLLTLSRKYTRNKIHSLIIKMPISNFFLITSYEKILYSFDFLVVIFSVIKEYKIFPAFIMPIKS